MKGNSKNGGCGLVSKDILKFSIRDDLCKSHKDNNSEFEAFWVEIEKSRGSNVMVAVIYNHPRRNPINFVDYLETQVKAISKEKKLVAISGDVNLDLVKYEKVPAIDNFFIVLLSSSYQPLILQPSRFTDNSRPTLIHNIFINSIDTVLI